ncbi:secretogranin-3-like isoform X1 [Xyrauchen texanus]|uniref:secretogranin-3-like isoform X1 n=1 Tax=Xyrauchen texanus TaxID=154827 RepID=UPI002242C1EC|nr:secretogranin-3-like isoform X1 [Xyrauchen texanus]
MVSKRVGFVVVVQVLAVIISHINAFPTPAGPADKSMFNRELTEEKPLEQQIAEADSNKKTEPKPTAPAEAESNSEDDDITFLKSLAEKSKESNNETPISDSADERNGADDADSTKNRRLADDYDSTKNGMDYKYQDDPESFRQLDGSPLTAQDIVQKIANKIYEEDDRGVFDRIVSKLLKLGLITNSQAETLEYEVAEALQDLVTKNAKENIIGDLSMDYPINAAKDTQSNMVRDDEDRPSRRYDEEVEDAGDQDNGAEEQEKERRDDTVRADDSWDDVSDGNDRNELNPEDGLQDLQFFPNFYRLLKSLDSEQDKEERETLITIMKTLIDFVKMMVKYGTITPEEGVSYLENLDAMIALQTKNKLGKPLGPLSIMPPTGKALDDDDNTKAGAAKMQQNESLKDSTKDIQTATEISHPGKSESYLDAIRKNIEWLKKHKDGNKEDYDLSKLRDFMDQQVDAYIDKGIIAKDEGDVIKRIYGSL